MDMVHLLVKTIDEQRLGIWKKEIFYGQTY